MVHVYCGNGKGKTTAAAGLALRALGAGYNVVVVQFLKDGSSGEMRLLRELGVHFFSNEGIGSIFSMSSAENKICEEQNRENFINSLKKIDEDKDNLIIFDEILGAIKRRLFDINTIENYLKTKGREEVVLTGRILPENLERYADYITDMRKLKHPFDNGIKARYGIEK